MLDHTSLVNERISNWTVGGYDVDVERQNAFALRSRTATLEGQPDLIARRDDEAVIIDAKTSHDSPSHVVQVMISCTPFQRRCDPTGKRNSVVR